MATINFVNNTLIPGTTVNPGLEDVVMPGGTILTHDAKTFQIQNTAAGAFHNFIFQLTSNAGGGTGDFAYNGTKPTAGTISGINVLAPGGTHIIDVDAGVNGFNDAKLVDFFTFLNNPTFGKFVALDELLGKANMIVGDGLGDHLTVMGFDHNDIFGNNGDDVITARNDGNSNLVGGNGNDTFRLSGFPEYDLVAGGNKDGSGGAGEINTVEVRGGGGSNQSVVSFVAITNINALHFIDDQIPVPPVVAFPANLDVQFRANQIGAGLVSPTLAVDGSTTASPHSSNGIFIGSRANPADIAPVNLDLSRWTFTNWNQAQNHIEIETNSAVAVSDHVVGTPVADFISTFDGNDTLQGGRGADSLEGGDGNDTFVYGAGEAAANEDVSGGFGPFGGIDTVRVLGNNDFTGMFFDSIDRLEFAGAATATFDQFFIDNPAAAVIGDGNANVLAFQMQKTGGPGGGGVADDVAVATSPAIDLSGVTFQNWSAADRVTITGTDGADAISGSSQRDVIDGKGGSDLLQGNGGKDAFRFDTAFGHGVDHVGDFVHGQDVIQLDNAVFRSLHPGVLGKKAFGTGTHAATGKEHILFDQDTGTLRYDDDGSGKHHAHIIAVLDDVSNLGHGDILVI